MAADGKYHTRPLPLSFVPWIDLSTDAEILALLELIKTALARRGFTVAFAVTKGGV